MGGGSSVTFPGYHIFLSYITLLTGIPNHIAHALVVSLFSSLIVLVAFLITRKVWNVQAAVIVALLVAISRFDIEMLMWGGYPNVITLMLIPLAFYLFLEKDRFSALPFLAVTSLISASIFLTHSLSSALFMATTLATVALGTVFASSRGKRGSLLTWLLPLVVGALIIAPFLIQVAPAYLGSDANTFTGGVADITLALLSTKTVPYQVVLPLFAAAFLYFAFSKYYIGKYFTVPTILLVMWWLIPVALTQGYLVGLYTDYERFLYFVLFPLIVLVGLGLYHSGRFFAQASDWLVSVLKQTPQVRAVKNRTLQRLLPHLEHRNFLLAFMLILVLYVSFAIPIFAPPGQGAEVQSFYQLMDNPRYEAIKWAKSNTHTDAVFLTDAQYGWWFSGFAERPTISAVEPQYLTNAREFEPAQVARYVLDTDYLVDNGLIQVREDGGYVGRHNPVFLAKLNDTENTYFPYGFFNLNNGQITVTFRDADGKVLTVDMAEVPVSKQLMENTTDYASFAVIRDNGIFNFTQTTTVYRGLRFTNTTAAIAAHDPAVTFDTIRFLLHTKGIPIEGEDESTIAFFDVFMRVAGQLVFTGGQPQVKVFTVENPSSLEMTYNLGGQPAGGLEFFAGVYPYGAKPDPTLTLKEELNIYEAIAEQAAQDFLKVDPEAPELYVFDYAESLRAQNVSYIALRDSEQVPRFAKDPAFSLVFINEEVAIFQVRR